MLVSDYIACNDFPCIDVNHERHIIPNIDLSPDKIRLVMISESAPEDPLDYYYAAGNPLYQINTIQAFSFSGLEDISFQDLLDMGFYFTTAVKCGKTGYGIKANTIKTCSHLLEKELELFPSVKVYMLMGDVAIKSINYIAKRNGEGRPVPAGSTYKIRDGEFFFRKGRVLPSYMQVGPSFGIEKSKQRMIGEDITKALKIIGETQ
jgi:hypothetical protein